VLAEYAKKQRARVYADLFITDRLSVARGAGGEQVASIFGNSRSVAARGDGVHIPVVAMLFGLPKGSHEVEFRAMDPDNNQVATWPATISVGEKQRVAFASAHLRFNPKVHGKYHVVALREGKEIGRSLVNLELEDDDDDQVDEDEEDAVDDGDPDVDIVVAQGGNDDPLMMRGFRSAWYERSYPRRVGFTWMARGTRGWSGRQVSISAYELDDAGNIVGRSDGCFQRELRPAYPWSCFGVASPSLATQEGAFDIVFAINDKPVAWWPMEAAIRRDHAPGSAVDRWMRELKRHNAKKQHKPGTPTPPTPKPPTPPATPPKPPTTPPTPKK
jgi:hypothetical protein